MSAFAGIGFRRVGRAARLAAALATLGFAATAQELEPRRIVVELFTSQGCSSCPPADALLAELAERDDVIALSLHVDYWDHLGWKDPFGSPAFSERQRGYMRELGVPGRGVTPQMVVQGSVGHAGSRPSVIEMSIERLTTQSDLVSVGLARDGDALTIRLEPTRAGRTIRLSEPLPVVVVGYDGPHSVEIPSGENGGATLVYANVARDYRTVGAWSGGTQTLTTEIDAGLVGYAVIVQFPGPGRIVGADAVEF